MGRDVTSGPVTNDLQLPQLSSLPTKVSTSSRSPATSRGSNERGGAISDVVLRGWSRRGPRRHRCTSSGRGPASAKTATSSVASGRYLAVSSVDPSSLLSSLPPSAQLCVAPPSHPQGVHRTRRPERHHSARRTASASLMTPPRSAQLSPPSRAPSRDGLVNEGYSSD
ncbi:hypothetical protein MRX96_040205 [Rhipicephalus microplus]